MLLNLRLEQEHSQVYAREVQATWQYIFLID